MSRMMLDLAYPSLVPSLTPDLAWSEPGAAETVLSSSCALHSATLCAQFFNSVVQGCSWIPSQIQVAVGGCLGAAPSARTVFAALKWCLAPARGGWELCGGLVDTWPCHPMGTIACDDTQPPSPINVTRSLTLRSVM